MPLPRLIATDLDGTLLRDDGKVSDHTRDVLHRAIAAGIHIVPVTGRPVRRLRPIVRELGLVGVAVCANGALLYDMASDAVIEQTLLSAEVARDLIVRLRAALPDICFAVENGAKLGREPQYLRNRPAARDVAVEIGDAIELTAQGAIKLIAMHPYLPLEEFLSQARAIVAERASVTHAGSPFLEIAAAGVTKAWALAAHCEREGIAAAEVVAFGDMPNDLPMLEWAGRAVAVANAHPSVLSVAREVTASNQEDGVAQYIERQLALR